MTRDEFLTIAQLLVSGADEPLLSELKGLVFWRERELRAARVLAYAPGDEVEYLLRDGSTRRTGTVSHLNKFSLSLWRGAGQTVAVPIERIVRRLDRCAICGVADKGLVDLFVTAGRDAQGRPAVAHRECYYPPGATLGFERREKEAELAYGLGAPAEDRRIVAPGGATPDTEEPSS